MPPRGEDELDPVTLQNQALMHMVCHYPTDKLKCDYQEIFVIH
jgi:hypothetical protein